MAKQLLRPALLLVLGIALMARSASAAPLIDVFDTFGVGHSYNPGAFYLVEEGVRQIAVPFAVSQPLTIAQIDVAAVGTGIQVRIASNGPGNLPGIPFFGGLGFDANGFFSFSPCISCGTLPSAGTYWFIMTGSFGFPSEIHWFENNINLIGTLAVDTVSRQQRHVRSKRLAYDHR